MSQYNYSEAQKRILQQKHIEDTEAEKDIRMWDTPYDEPMTLAEARAAAQRERDKWKTTIES